MSDLREPDIERLLAAFARRKHDRVPHFDFIDPGNVGAILGRDPAKCARNDALSGADAVRVAKATCMDFVLVSIQFWPGTTTPSGLVNGWADLPAVRPVDTAAARWKVQDFLAASKGTKLGVGIDVAGPFFSTYMSMGPVPIQSFMLALHDDRALVEELMDLQVERQIERVAAIADLPIAFVEIADDVCDNHGFMVEPALMETLWVPRYLSVLRACQALGVPVMSHCCGKLDAVLPRLVEWGICAVSPVQPNCNDIYALGRTWGDRICLVGNISIQGVLAFGTPADVEVDVKEHIERLAGHGGYVVASSHSIVDAIPPANYRAMVAAVLKYGRYDGA